MNPYLPEAPLADLGDDLQLVPRELPLAVRWRPRTVRVIAVAGALPVAVGIWAVVVKECS